MLANEPSLYQFGVCQTRLIAAAGARIEHPGISLVAPSTVAAIVE